MRLAKEFGKMANILISYQRTKLIWTTQYVHQPLAVIQIMLLLLMLQKVNNGWLHFLT